MSELTFNLMRLGYLLLLWFFVFSAVAVLRRDISIRGHSSGRTSSFGGSGPYSNSGPYNSSGDDAAAGTWVNPADSPLNTSANPLGGGPVGPPLTTGPAIVVGPGANPPAPPPPATPAIPAVPKYLAITSGALAGSRLPLSGQPITIGRAPSNTLVIDDDYASGHHARLYPTPDGWVLEDLGSTNGTLVAGGPLLGSVLLPVETPVTIGHSAFKLVR